MASCLGLLEVEDNSPLRQKGQQRFLIDKGDALVESPFVRALPLGVGRRNPQLSASVLKMAK